MRCREPNDASFQLAPLGWVLAGVRYGVGAFRDACIISVPSPSPTKGIFRGIPDFFPHDTDRWALNLLQRGRAEGRADDSPAARIAFFVANFGAALCAARRSVPPCGTGLSGLWSQRLAGRKKVCVYVRSHCR